MMQFHQHTRIIALAVIGGGVAASIALLNDVEPGFIAAAGLSSAILVYVAVQPVFWMVITTIGSLTFCVAAIAYLAAFEILWALGCMALMVACSAGFLATCGARVATDYGPYHSNRVGRDRPTSARSTTRI